MAKKEIKPVGYLPALAEMRSEAASAALRQINAVAYGAIAYIAGASGIGTVGGAKLGAKEMGAEVRDIITNGAGVKERRAYDLANIALQLARKLNNGDNRKAIINAESLDVAHIFVRGQIVNVYGAANLDQLKAALAGQKSEQSAKEELTKAQKIKNAVSSAVAKGEVSAQDLVDIAKDAAKRGGLSAMQDLQAYLAQEIARMLGEAAVHNLPPAANPGADAEQEEAA